MSSASTVTSPLAYDEAGQGTPVLLLHAFPLSRQMWRPQLEGLRDHCRVIAPDLPGFGATPAGVSPSVDGMAEKVARLIDHLDLPPVVLGGLSMGGYVALAFARKYPTRLRALILADTRAEADDAEGKANRDKLITLAQQNAQGVIEQMLPKLLGPATQEKKSDVVAEVRRIAGQQSGQGIVAALQAMRDRPDSVDLLEKLMSPALVLVGADDALTPKARAEVMVQRLPKARLVVLEGAGHLSNLEAPEAFNAAVREFVAGLG